MISVNEADAILNNCLLVFDEEFIPLSEAQGRILAEPITADRDFPPFDRVMMDGIAIVYGSWKAGQRAFRIEKLQAAGDPPSSLSDVDTCMEVMTGAILPKNCDTVIRYEDVEVENGYATLHDDLEILKGQHIHRQGTDRGVGELLLHPGGFLGAAEIGIMATVGSESVRVKGNPSIAVVATGDELVPVNEIPEAHQIRMSNLYSIRSLLEKAGYMSAIHHIKDDRNALRESLRKLLHDHQVVILSGGVSKGKFDFVPGILDELGVEKRFHFVRQRPGKPFWFGQHKHGVVFALPGNPVSSFLGTVRYVLPFLCRSAGLTPKVATATLIKDTEFSPSLTYFLQVSLKYDTSGHLLATPVPGRGSGDLANLAEADAFLELPAEQTIFKEGESFPCHLYR